MIGMFARLAGVVALALALFAALEPAGRGDAQGPPASGDSVSAYVLGRVSPLPPGDAGGSYVIEFGVLPVSMGGSAADVSANERFLPGARRLTEAMISERAQAGNRRWLRSSAVSIPVGGGGNPACS